MFYFLPTDDQLADMLVIDYFVGGGGGCSLELPKYHLVSLKHSKLSLEVFCNSLLTNFSKFIIIHLLLILFLVMFSGQNSKNSMLFLPRHEFSWQMQKKRKHSFQQIL